MPVPTPTAPIPPIVASGFSFIFLRAKSAIDSASGAAFVALFATTFVASSTTFAPVCSAFAATAGENIVLKAFMTPASFRRSYSCADTTPFRAAIFSARSSLDPRTKRE